MEENKKIEEDKVTLENAMQISNEDIENYKSHYEQKLI